MEIYGINFFLGLIWFNMLILLYIVIYILKVKMVLKVIINFIIKLNNILFLL